MWGEKIREGLRSLLTRLARSEGRLPLYWLTADIAFSRAPRPEDWPLLRQLGFRSVVDLRAEAGPDDAPAAAAAVAYRRLPVPEGGVPDDDELRRLTDWLAENIASLRPVLIYCREGLGRSPLIACASLVRLGMPLPEAYAALRRARESIALSDEQARALQRFALSLQRPSRSPRPSP